MRAVLGRTVGSYRIVEELGEGGMGEVYRAVHTTLGRKAAVKLLLEELSHNKEVVTRFFNEAKAATAIDHPGIVSVFDFGYAEDGRAFIIMEFLEGESLGARRRRGGPMPLDEVLTLGRQVAGALGAAHRQGIVHRDLKPDNIMIVLDPDVLGGQRAKILDFGIAKLLDQDRDKGPGLETKSGSIIGTPAYMSPEQCRGAGKIDARADIYALGCVLYALICGEPPFDGEGAGELIAAHISQPPPTPRSWVKDLPQAVEDVLLRLLAKKPEDRYQTMNEVVEALEAASAGKLPAHLGLKKPPDPRADDTLRLPESTDGAQPSTLRSAVGQSVSATPSRKSRRRQLTTDSQETRALRHAQKFGKRWGVWKWVVVVALVLGSGGAWWSTRRPPKLPAPVADQDESVRIYLDGAETLAKEKRFELAAEVLGKASGLNTTSPNLQIRLARVTDLIIMGGILKKASSQLKDSDYRGAIDAAKAALDRDSENAEALRILTAARTGLKPPEPEEPKEKSHERSRDGSIAITTSPPAMIYIDDEPVGRSPIARQVISAGYHTIQARAQGHLPATQRIKVGHGQAISLVMPLGAAGNRAPDEDMAFKLPQAAVAKIAPPGSKPPGESPPAAAEAPAISSGPATPSAKVGPGAPSSASRPSSGAVGELPSQAPTAAPPGPTLTPPPAPVAAKPALRPPSTTTSTPEAPKKGPVVSVMPRSPIPKPTLPRSPVAESPEQVARLCQLVESAVVSLAGVSPEFARGITGPLRRAVSGGGPMYGVAMYYFIIREASLQHDSQTAAQNLATAHSNGILLKMKDLPGNDREL
jgi:serine/threonine protein kinase